MYRACRVAAPAARAAPQNLGRPAPKFAAPAFQRLHTGVPRREEEKPAVQSSADDKLSKYKTADGKFVLTPGYIFEKLGLDDWRRSLPLGIFLAIPAIKHEWFILDEEAMLAGVFILFFGSMNAAFGSDIAAFFDKRRDTWLAWRNAQEDAEIDKVLEAMKYHQVRMEQLQIGKDLIALQRETMVKQAKAESLAQPHVTRDATLAMLDTAVAHEANEWNNAQTALIEEALAAVTKQVQSDAGLKKQALTEALSSLGSDGSKAQGTDAVSKLFVDFFKRKQEEAKKEASVEKTTTPKELESLSEQVDAFAARFSNVKGIEEYKVKAKKLIPKTYKGSLQRAFLLAQAQAMGK